MENGDMLKLDQSQLETVIPLVGGKVKVVNGAYRGDEAVLTAVNVDKYTATVKLETGPKTGSSIEVDYEDICKLQK
jgi:DNA/RNA-binding protein KIN17